MRYERDGAGGANAEGGKQRGGMMWDNHMIKL
jgi:hypothetical protein